MKQEEIEKQWKETIKNIVNEQIRKLIQIDFTCPYCGKKYTIKELGEWEESKREKKEYEANCENCEHAYRGADPLKIIQDSKYLFYCAAGHAYGGADTVCSEWKRKEDEANGT